MINKYYDFIVCMLKRSTSRCVPRIPFKCLKAFWNDDLDRLKELSIDMHNLWRQVGSPRVGIINMARLKAKAEYKQAIKTAASDFKRNNADDLNRNFNDKDHRQF